MMLIIACGSSLERKDSEISPSTVPAAPPPLTNARGTIAPWEPSYHEQAAPSIPAIHREPPSANPWSSSNNKPTMPTSVFGGTFYNDSTDDLGQVSPGYAPPNGMGFPNDDHRRPSVASASTMSSTGSKSSVGGRFHKKLGAFFGDDYRGLQEDASRQGSETSSMQNLPAFAPGGGRGRDRNNSLNDVVKNSGPPSPSSSRPRTPAPAPSSEVTPWLYQDTQVS